MGLYRQLDVKEAAIHSKSVQLTSRVTLRRKCTAKTIYRSCDTFIGMVGERLYVKKVYREECQRRSENAGMSSERQVRILSTVRLRFPKACPPRLVGTWARPKGVSDGQQKPIFPY